VGFQGLDVASLIFALSCDAFLSEGARASGREGPAELRDRSRSGGGDSEQGLHFMAVGNAAFAEAGVVVAQNAGGTLDLFRSAFDFQVAVLQLRGDLQGGLEKLQVFVESAE